VLADAGPGVRRETLARAGARAESWTDEERKVLADAVLPLLGSAKPADRAAGARAVAVLRLTGARLRLLALLGKDEPEVRAAAAHALSRAPDLEASRDSLRPHLLPLLEDPAPAVRTAGLLLAEAWLGEPIAFDPAAPEAARRAALAEIRARLSP
jgi:hypothetical protein